MDNGKPKFVRNGEDKEQGNRFPLRSSFRCALQGIVYTVTSQRNLKIQAVFAVVALVLAALLQIPLEHWIAILICMFLVFAAECINTAVESIVDLLCPEYHELAKHAKDCAAGAVLIVAALSVVVAIVVYGNALMSFINA